jgi:hypothetical protein
MWYKPLPPMIPIDGKLFLEEGLGRDEFPCYCKRV